MPAYAFRSQADYEASTSDPNIDFISVHEYDPNTGESSHVTNEADTAARNQNKPVYIGEDGFTLADNGGDTGSQTGNAIKLTAEYTAYMNDPYVAGVMHWDFFFFGSGDTSAMYQGSPLFEAEANYKNPYPGSPDGATGSPTPTPTPTPPPAPLGVGSYDDTAPEIDYASSWQTSTNPAEYNGDDHYSHITGDTATLSFTGNQVRYWFSQAPQHGIAAVSIDGGAAASVDLYAANRIDGVASWTSPVLTSGNHVLKIAVSGTKNTASSDIVISIDRIDVLAGTSTPTVSPSPTITTSPTATPIHLVGDMNYDGKVNIFDLSYLLSKWGTADAKADLDHNGNINVFDLSALLAHWTG
jgi:mannan endo-1,4-beta-mannosidase